MKTALPTLLLASLLSSLLTSLSAATTDKTPSVSNGSSAQEKQGQAVKGSQKMLLIGMSGAEVRKTIGKPATIAPLVVKDKQAEVWTYRRPLGTRVRQISASVQRQPSLYAPGSCKHETLVNEPVIQLETLQVTEITELLFLNDELIIAKRHEESRPASVD